MCKVSTVTEICPDCTLRTTTINKIERCSQFEVRNSIDGLGQVHTCARSPIPESPTFVSGGDTCANCAERKCNTARTMLAFYTPLLVHMQTKWMTWYLIRQAARDTSRRETLEAAIGYKPDIEVWKCLLDMLQEDLVEAVVRFESVKGEVCKAIDALAAHISQGIVSDEELDDNPVELVRHLYYFAGARDMDWTCNEAWLPKSLLRGTKVDVTAEVRSVLIQCAIRQKARALMGND